MKEVKTIAKSAHFTAVDFGKLSEIKDYVLHFAPGVDVPGKVFGGQAVGATGGEFSFQSFAPGQESLLHKHTKHEELYFFLSGKGEYEVDGQKFPITEGSVVRVAPEGHRTLRNNGTEPLLMLCVQYLGNTFTEKDAEDAVML